jgi:hypothetical protein
LVNWHSPLPPSPTWTLLGRSISFGDFFINLLSWTSQFLMIWKCTCFFPRDVKAFSKRRWWI